MGIGIVDALERPAAAKEPLGHGRATLAAALTICTVRLRVVRRGRQASGSAALHLGVDATDDVRAGIPGDP